MRKLKESAYRINRFEKQDTVNELNPSVVVLKYIEPARELLESSNLMNSVYKKQLNYLPYIFKCCDQLHPLAQSRNDEQNFSYNPDMVVNIYRRDLSLKINPFETKNYFRSTGSEFRPKTKTQVQNHSSYNLSFDSHFESGNLLSVDKEVLNQRYHLMMQNDINTYGCTQWFFFRALNKEPAKITMLINNFYKISSLYQKGMKVLIFSMKKYVNEGVGWIRGGDQIAYFPNKITQKKLSNGNVKQFYTLKFSYYLEYDNDEVYFAYNYPYTYSKLNSYLSEKQISKNIYFNCRTLCKTAAQNKLFLLTITDNSVDKSKKNSIFVTSRVHPGQTVSSLIAQGIIDFLISDNPVAQALRQRFIFKIVPMLNPDGVIHGNYRTNLAGLDLNRVWDSADKFLSPQIYQIKKYIIEYNKQCPVMMFCDLHGHSARKSAFIYGCQREKLKLINVDEECRLFPFMLSCQNQDFLYKSCNFKMDKSKKGTARIQLWKQLRIPNIFTLQASFCSSQNSQYHFRPTDYSQIGVSFCKTIHQYFLNANKRKQFYQKLKLVKQNFSKKADSDQQTDSDNDLLDQKTINQLKNGLAVETLWNKRKLIIERPPSIESQTQKKQKKVLPKRRITIDRSRKVAKTETSPQLNTAIITISSKKTITTSIPTKRLTLDTDVMKYAQPKGCLKGSIFQRVEHNYRGKSTIYRIQRKNVKNFCNLNNEVYKKGSSIFEMDNSLDLY